MESVKPIHEGLVKDFCIRSQLLQKAEKKWLDLAWLVVSTFRIFFSGKPRGKLGYLVVIVFLGAFYKRNLNLLDLELDGETIWCRRNQISFSPGRSPRNWLDHYREPKELLGLAVVMSEWIKKWANSFCKPEQRMLERALWLTVNCLWRNMYSCS